MVQGTSFWREVLKVVLSPTLLLLSLAGGVRQGAGLVWSYNVKTFFGCSVNIGTYMSWVPLVGGTLGAVLGGFLSDRLMKRRGQVARFWVLIISQLVAAPFLVGAVFLPPNPWAFLSLLPAYIVGEVWIGVCLAIIIEMVPRRVVAMAVAFFLFVINNIGGVFPLLIPALHGMMELRYVMCLLFPGAYVVAAILFGVTLVVKLCTGRCLGSRHVLDQRHMEEEREQLLNSTKSTVAMTMQVDEDGYVFCDHDSEESTHESIAINKRINFLSEPT